MTALETSTPGARIDAKIGPHGDFVSYIRNSNIWLCHLKTQQEIQLTHGPAGILNGVADYLIQEEFDRFTGYFWAPFPDNEEVLHRILFVQVDETQVESLSVGAASTDGKEPERCRYPRPGCVNPKSDLCLLEFNQQVSICYRWRSAKLMVGASSLRSQP